MVFTAAPSPGGRARRGRLDRLRDARGFTLVELVATLAILSIVLGGLTTVLVTASKHETLLDKRFQAQQSARLALSTLRRELHCATAVAPASGATTTITLTLPSGCPSGTGPVTWCTAAGTGGYDLWRVPGSACTTNASGAVRWAQSLTVSQAFTPDATTHATPTLPSVSLVLSVSQGTGDRPYTLTDTIYLRNGKWQ